MINRKLLKDSKRSTELQMQGTNQARTCARYAMSKVQQERFLMKDDESKELWGQYFNMQINQENQRVETEERDPNQAMTRNISEEKTEPALKGMKSGKAVGCRRNTS